MTESSYLRFPHLHGDLLTFTAEDDVWVAPLSGGRAWRVSADNMPVERPYFSPDGERIAWTSTRDGTWEVLFAPVDGGSARRITYWGHRTTRVCGWASDQAVLVTTAASEASTCWTWAHAVPIDGGPARRLPFGPVGGVAVRDREALAGPTGSAQVGMARGVLLKSASGSRDAAAWKRYRGGTAGKLWISAPTTAASGGEAPGHFVRVHQDLDGNLEAPMWVGGRIAFLSDHEGVGALYSSFPDGSDLRRHSAVDGFYARHATTDGSRVVYCSAGELWIVDDLVDGTPRRLPIKLGGSRIDVQPQRVRARNYLGDASPDHTGRGSAVEVRGTVHWVTHREGPTRALSAQPGVRARHPRVVCAPGLDTQVVWVTDAEGEDALEFAPSTGAAPGATPRRIGVGQLGRVLELVVSPDGHRIAIASHDGRVLLVETETGEVREVARSDDGDVNGLAFSPDSGWLAWSHPGPSPLRQLKIANTADLSVADATPLRFNDYSPTFTLDGKHLAFLSIRSFDPVYDTHVFDMSFNAGCRPHLITLAATTLSPFGPQRHGRPIGAPDRDQDGRDAKSDGDQETSTTRVDLDGLADRIIPFPVQANHYSSLCAVKGGVVWLRHPVQGVLGANRATPDAAAPTTTLERFDLTALSLSEIGDDVDSFEATGDGNRLLLVDGGTLQLINADGKSSDDMDGGGDSVTVDLSRVRITVDPAREWRQMFAEAGRLMRDHFYRADLGGVDWAAVLDRYRPILDRISTHDDLVDLLWEVQGELGTSHAYVQPPRGRRDRLRGQGLLGANLERVDGDPEDGTPRWHVTRVLPSETSDPQARSPLAAPGVAVRPGDAIVAVDGHPVDPVTGPGPLLVGTAGKPTELTVAPSGGGNQRHVVVMPLDDDQPLRYHDWVAGRRAHVHQRSAGRLGYMHVPDMMGPGWAQLHRDLRVEVTHEGLIVDLRENSGGHISELVAEKLARKIIGWNHGRGMTPVSYPLEAPRGPIIAVANEFSASDGDIINAAIQALSLGPVVGTRTWGGVVGIDSRFALVDGTMVTQPKYAMWLRGYGWDVENHGVDPDVEVVCAPHDYAAGRDPQLDTAIQLALDALAERPAAAPPSLPEL